MIKKIILTALFLGISLPVLAKECSGGSELHCWQPNSILEPSYQIDDNGDLWLFDFNKKGEKEKFYLFNCNQTENIQMGKNICSKCPNREYKDGWCVLKERK